MTAGKWGGKARCAGSLRFDKDISVTLAPASSAPTTPLALQRRSFVGFVLGLAGEEYAAVPMQQAWLDRDVAQCGYCQPGQIMAAVATVNRARREGRSVTEADLDSIRNICRCGTYSRIREAIKAGAQKM